MTKTKISEIKTYFGYCNDYWFYSKFYIKQLLRKIFFLYDHDTFFLGKKNIILNNNNIIIILLLKIIKKCFL